jgi:preprotein translocase subunit YajC
MPTISLHLAQTTPTNPAAAAAAAPTSDQILTGAAPSTTGTVAPGTAPATAPSSGFGGMGIIPLLFVMVAVMMLMTTLSGRKEKKKRQALMESLGKGDKVLTIGGQIGIVDAVRDNEVVLRIDENSNTKARFTKASIQQVLESAGKGATESDSGSTGTIEVKTKGEKLLSAR